MPSFLRLLGLFCLLPLSLMSATATGTFDVQLTPAPPTENDPADLGRMIIAKQFAGDLVGTSTGQMLMVRTATAGSAGYVAIETVSATLDGKTGTFILQHTGTMNRGAPSLAVTVVPDSATADLVGLTGSMSIDAKADGHHYVFTYTLPGDK